MEDAMRRMISRSEHHQSIITKRRSERWYNQRVWSSGREWGRLFML